MESNRKTTSNFVNPIGIALWGIMTVLFYYNGLPEAAGIFFLFFLLFLSAWLWNRSALSKLDIDSDAGRQCAFPGGHFTMRCRVVNRKLLPLMWLELIFPLPENGCITPSDSENSKPVYDEESGDELPGACARISWLLWHQESSLEIPMEAVHRGVCLFNRAAAASGDGFGLGSKERFMPLAASPLFVVYPHIVPIQANLLTQSTSDIEAGRNGYMEDVTLLKMNRSYEPGDSAKKINWRQMARQGTAMTNIYETIFPRMAAFFLDLPSFRTYTVEKNSMTCEDVKIWTPLTAELERMISLAASCILRLTDNSICCGLVLPELPDKKPVIYYPGRHGSSPEELLYQLAAVNYHIEEAYFPYADIAGSLSLFGTVYVITNSYESMTIRRDFLAKASRSLILVNSPSDKDSLCPFRLIRYEDLTERCNS